MRTSAPKITKAQELDLIARFRKGDSAAFDHLYSSHRHFVYCLGLRLYKGKTEDAEDHVQDTFMQIHRKLHLFRGDSRFSTWVYRISFNVFLMKTRTRKHPMVSLEEFTDQEETKTVEKTLGVRDEVLESSVVRTYLQRAIEELPPGYRTVFTLHDIEGFEHREIAKMVGYTIGCSKSQLHKSREKLRFLLTGRVIPRINARKENAPVAKRPQSLQEAIDRAFPSKVAAAVAH